MRSLGSGHLVEVGEAFEVLHHAQAQVQARRLGHDRDSTTDLHAVLGRERDSRDGGGAAGRSSSVPSVRTVVVFPAPLGPRNPSTSPRPTSNETSSNATRSPNRFDRCSTESAGALVSVTAGDTGDRMLVRGAGHGKLARAVAFASARRA